MSLNEVKLTLAIEDPTTRDQREYMGVEVLCTSPLCPAGLELLPMRRDVGIVQALTGLHAAPRPQDESGASRDEVAAALVEVSEGRVPKDRIALQQLYREIMEWPFINEALPAAEEAAAASSSSPYEAITDTGIAAYACMVIPLLGTCSQSVPKH